MLKYQFPAVKGCQAGKDYYICMVPLGLMSKIFATDSSDVPAEYRAQRKLNEARIPEICGYILSNRDSYVFSALAASVDGDMKFVPADSNENAGLLEIDMTASFLINDGQHRKAAIEAAIAEDESLKEETISIVLYKDQGLQRSQQMFTDLNKHAVTTSKSLNTLYESKDPVALITKNVVNSISFLRKYTDKEKDNLSKYSSNIFTLNTFYTANKRTIRSAPFAIFNRQDLLQLALDLKVPVPEIYGSILKDEDGRLYTSGEQRTGCSMCGFGIQLEKRPHRFDRLRERNYKEWDFWMNRCCLDENGTPYGWGKVLDYLGIGWRDIPDPHNRKK